MSSNFRPTSYILPAIVLALGTITVASAQSSSPFAKKVKEQAWETLPKNPPVSAPSLPNTPAPNSFPNSLPANGLPTNGLPTNRLPQGSIPSVQTNTGPHSNEPLSGYEYRPRSSSPFSPQTPQGAPSQAGPVAPASNIPAPEGGVYYPGRRNGGQTPKHNIGSYERGSHKHSQSGQGQAYYPPASTAQQPNVQYHQDGSGAPLPQGFQQPNYGQPDYTYPSSGDPNASGAQYNQSQYDPNQYSQNQYGQDQYSQASAYQGQPLAQKQPAKRSWKDRLGLGKFRTLFTGGATVGAAAVQNPDGQGGWDAEFIGDADAGVEVSAITQGGLEYGVNLRARAQYDRFRRGFGQRLPDCPPTEAGCSSALVDGTPTGLRGHTSQFYTDGTDDGRAEEIQLESAYVFLRSAYGDVTLGRDDGAAYLFSLGAPSLLKVGASNSPVDYTGLDSVKTVNDASGFAEKATYITPRLLGDTVGVGVQLGVSYAPNAKGCGVDYCVRSNTDQGSGTIAADLQNVIEAGLALDRKFDNGLKVEATANYARADERSGFEGLDDLRSFNAGLELTYNDWVLGGSYLNSNNGLVDGDYEAYDIGLTWKPSRFGFTLGYGHAEDDNVNLSSDQAVFGVSYDFDKITLGTGVQYIDRTTDVFNGLTVERQSEDAFGIFIETGFKF